MASSQRLIARLLGAGLDTVSTPAMSQPTSIQPGLPMVRAMSADTRKIPEPIIEPMTTMVES